MAIWFLVLMSYTGSRPMWVTGLISMSNGLPFPDRHLRLLHATRPSSCAQAKGPSLAVLRGYNPAVYFLRREAGTRRHLPLCTGTYLLLQAAVITDRRRRQKDDGARARRAG